MGFLELKDYVIGKGVPRRNTVRCSDNKSLLAALEQMSIQAPKNLPTTPKTAKPSTLDEPDVNTTWVPPPVPTSNRPTPAARAVGSASLHWAMTDELKQGKRSPDSSHSRSPSNRSRSRSPASRRAGSPAALAVTSPGTFADEKIHLGRARTGSRSLSRSTSPLQQHNGAPAVMSYSMEGLQMRVAALGAPVVHGWNTLGGLQISTSPWTMHRSQSPPHVALSPGRSISPSGSPPRRFRFSQDELSASL